MNVYDWAWLGWVVYFLAFEIAAIVDKSDGGTLSEHVWDLFAVKDEAGDVRHFVIARRLSLLFGLAWLVSHFVSGWRFP